MNNENKPLTAEEIAHAYGANIIGYNKKVDKNITGRSPRYLQAINDFMAGHRFADQQTAAIREELEAVKKENAELKRLIDGKK